MKGILFKPWKIKAIAYSAPDKEWQTRRVMQNQPYGMDKYYEKAFRKDFGARKPRYLAGETVYIKETLYRHPYLNEAGYVLDETPVFINRTIGDCLKWRWQKDILSAMFLPQEAARYFIRVTDVRAERTKDITPEDCLKEGIERHTDNGNNIFWYEIAGDYHGNTQSVTPQEAYFKLYDSINGEDTYGKNWDWVYSFDKA